MRRCLRSAAAALAATAAMLPAAVFAATTGGSGMPYSAGLNTFSTSVRGEIAGILILVGIVGGVGLWIAGGQLEGMLNTIARVIIGGCIVGGVVVFMTSIGITGAVM